VDTAGQLSGLLVRTRRFSLSLDECPCLPRVLCLLFLHPPSHVFIFCFCDTCVLCSQRRPLPVWPFSAKFVSANIRLSFIRPKLLSPCCPLGTQRSRQSEPPHCGRQCGKRLEDGEHTRASVRLPILYLNDYVATAFLSVVSLHSLPLRFQVACQAERFRRVFTSFTRTSPHRMNLIFPLRSLHREFAAPDGLIYLHFLLSGEAPTLSPWFSPST
jgi:hypothetical protein